MEKPAGGEGKKPEPPSFPLPYHYPLDDAQSPKRRFRWLSLIVAIGIGLCLAILRWRLG